MWLLLRRTEETTRDSPHAIAMMGRTIPRDLYDFEYLTNIEGIDLQDVFYEFQGKADLK